MIPCYQLCKDRQCPYWNFELLDCEHLPDDCEYAVDQLVSERENQYLDGEEHGCWRKWWENGKLRQVRYEFGDLSSVRYWRRDGTLSSVKGYKNERFHGLCREWHRNGRLWYLEYFIEGLLEGFWKRWSKKGELLEVRIYENGRCLKVYERLDKASY